MFVKIKGFPDYQIDESGNVIGAKGNALKRQTDKDGYLCVNLYKNKKQYNKKIHRLVADAFIPNPDGLPQVNHKDENKSNNDVSNLEWCNQKYNNNYGSRTEKTKKKVVCIETGDVFDSITNAATILNLKASRICEVCKGIQKTTGGYRFEYV